VSAENVEIVRRAWDAWGRGDIDGLVALVAQDAVFDTAHLRDWPEPEYVGHAGFRRFFTEWLEVWGGFETGVDEHVATPDGRVVSLFWQRGKGWRSGLGMDVKWAVIATVRDDKLLKVDVYESREEALKAVGLEE
jgi:ketosteroid isomerase-like protein